jgi:DTW domain-containing protein
MVDPPLRAANTASVMTSPVPPPEIVLCDRCRKPAALCVCAAVTPLTTRREVLILQHPREPDQELGSAIVAHLALPRSTLRVGLSWPNLSKALGHPAQAKEWLVLYLGSTRPRRSDKPSTPISPLLLIDRRGPALPPSPAALDGIRGIVALDGTWSQAKSLWWRNAWLLKLQRAILAPREPSLYRQLRREPRHDSLSTLEAIALALAALEGDELIVPTLLRPFRQLLAAAAAGRSVSYRGPSR